MSVPSLIKLLGEDAKVEMLLSSSLTRGPFPKSIPG